MKSALISPLLAGLLLLTGCAQPAAQAGGGGGGTIKAINHTKWAINHFSVNGQSGIDNRPVPGGRWRVLLQRARPLDAGYDGAR